ncbi:MAG: PAS domain S-box protein [Promethearchaeota archaeon]
MSASLTPERDWLELILSALKARSRGMTITEIAKSIGANRNTVARYLDTLLTSGQVEVQEYGPAKVFFLTDRLPFSSLMNSTSDGIVVLDDSLTVAQINDSLLKMIGDDKEEIIGKQLMKLTAPLVSEDRFISLAKKTLRGKSKTAELECVVRKSERYFRIKFIPVAFRRGAPGVTVIVEDITDRRSAERALVDSEQRFRTLFEQSNDGIFLRDEDGLILDVNNRLLEMLGYSRSDLVAHRVSELVPNDVLDAGREIIKQDEAKGGSVVELVARRKDGKSLHVERSAHALEIGGQKILQVILRNIEERKKAEVEIKRAATEWKDTFDAISDMITVIDSKFRILRANRAMVEAFGIQKKKLIGKHCYEVMHQLNEPHPDCPHVRTMESGKQASAEIFVTALNCQCHVTTSPILDETGERSGVVHIAKALKSN